jgi:hypothetical protein
MKAKRLVEIFSKLHPDEEIFCEYLTRRNIIENSDETLTDHEIDEVIYRVGKRFEDEFLDEIIADVIYEREEYE